MPSRPRCQRCSRRPSRRNQCPHCLRLVGPGCCWVESAGCCLDCQDAPEPEPELSRFGSSCPVATIVSWLFTRAGCSSTRRTMTEGGGAAGVGEWPADRAGDGPGPEDVGWKILGKAPRDGVGPPQGGPDEPAHLPSHWKRAVSYTHLTLPTKRIV